MEEILHPTVYKDDTGQIWLERVEDGRIFIHVHSYKYTPSTYKHYWNVWGGLLLELADKGIEEVYAGINNEKLAKFALSFGFNPTGEMFDDDKGNVRSVWKCSV